MDKWNRFSDWANERPAIQQGTQADNLHFIRAYVRSCARSVMNNSVENRSNVYT